VQQIEQQHKRFETIEKRKEDMNKGRLELKDKLGELAELKRKNIEKAKLHH